MLHGDIVTLTSEGIIVYEKALQPLGIFDDSLCWGVVAANPHDVPHYGTRNLIISPFHPSSWPYLIRLQIQLRDERGALSGACEFLTKNNLSILFAECTPTGFRHTTFTVIAESTKVLEELRDEKQNLDKKYPYERIPSKGVPTNSRKQNEAFTRTRVIANEIVACMYAHAKEIENSLEVLSQKGSKTFLHRWNADGEHFLYDRTLVAKLAKISIFASTP